MVLSNVKKRPEFEIWLNYMKQKLVEKLVWMSWKLNRVVKSHGQIYSSRAGLSLNALLFLSLRGEARLAS